MATSHHTARWRSLVGSGSWLFAALAALLAAARVEVERAAAQAVETLARGNGSIEDVRTSTACSVVVRIATAGGIPPLSFDAKVRRDGYRLDVSSPDDVFSCSLSGKSQLSGSGDCRFYVGGGKWRTPVSCPASGITGQLSGDALVIKALGCVGTLLGCDIAADAQIALAPVPPMPQPP